MKKYLLVMLVFLLLTPSVASACGMFLSSSNSNVRPKGIQAFISYDTKKEKEKIVVSMDYLVNEGNVKEFGWMMPFPNKPEIKESNEALFEALRKETEPKETLYEKLQGKIDDYFGPMDDDMMEGAVKGTLDTGAVDVVEEKSVGVYDVAVLRATSSKDILSWSDENGFVLKWEKTDLLDEYIKNDWYFVLMKLKSDAEGSIHPVEFTFQSKEVVYPIEMMKYDKEGKINEERYIPVTFYVASDNLLKPSIDLNYRYGGKLSKDWDYTNDTYITKWSEDLSSAKLTSDLVFTKDSELKPLNDGSMTIAEWVKFIGLILYGVLLLFVGPFYVLMKLSIWFSLIALLGTIGIVLWKNKKQKMTIKQIVLFAFGTGWVVSLLLVVILSSIH